MVTKSKYVGRWEQFKDDYPEIYGYLSGQASENVAAAKYLNDLAYLVDTTPHISILGDAIIPATEPATPPTGAQEGVQTWLGEFAAWKGDYQIRIHGDEFLVYLENDIVATLPEFGEALSWASNPATPQPETVGTGDGERWYYEWDENVVLDRNGITRLYADGKKAKFDITAILNEYETETRALKTELAAARERIAELEAMMARGMRT